MVHQCYLQSSEYYLFILGIPCFSAKFNPQRSLQLLKTHLRDTVCDIHGFVYSILDLLSRTLLKNLTTFNPHLPKLLALRIMKMWTKSIMEFQKPEKNFSVVRHKNSVYLFNTYSRLAVAEVCLFNHLCVALITSGEPKQLIKQKFIVSTRDFQL